MAELNLGSGVGSFVRTFSMLTQLKLAKDRQESQIAGQKDRLKLEQQRIKGAEASRQLQQQQLQQQLAGMMQSQQATQGIREILQGLEAPAPPLQTPAPDQAPVQAPEVTGDQLFDADSQRLTRQEEVLQQLLQLPPSKQSNLAIDNLQASQDALRKRQRNAILDRRRPGEQRIKIRQAIRSEDVMKKFGGARQGFDTVIAGAQSADNFGDLAMINGFARLLDPNSVVRPSEFETVRQARAALSRLEGSFARVARGEQLLPRERAQLVKVAKTVIRRYITAVQEEIEPIFGPIAAAEGIPFREVFIDPKQILAGSDVQGTPSKPGRSSRKSDQVFPVDK